MLKVFNCEFCNKEFKDYISNKEGNHVFCSKRCAALYRNKEHRIYKKCVVCGKPFSCVKSKPNTFCSKACSNTFRWKSGVYNHYPNPPKKKIKKVCLFCKKIFLVYPYRKLIAKYCSSKCFILDLYKKGKIPFKNTNIEKKMKILLNKLNLNYDVQYILDGRIFDFYISKYNLLIECDGDYWHGNLEKYPILNEKQKLRKRIDNMKNDIAENNNISLLRFWGSTILNNENEVEEKIINACV